MRGAERGGIFIGATLANILSLTAILLLQPGRIALPFGLLLGALLVVAAVGTVLGNRFGRGMSLGEQVAHLAGSAL